MASASAAKVSMIRLTQRSCTALRAGLISSSYTAVTNASKTAVMLTVIWNYSSQYVADEKKQK